MTYHRGVDEEHHRCGNLRQNGGDTQLYDQRQFLLPAHRATLSDIREQ